MFELFTQVYQIFFLPVEIIAILLITAIPLIFIYLFLRLSENAFEQIGFDHWHATMATFGAIIGSLIDIPFTPGPISSYPEWVIPLLGSSYPTTFHPVYLAVNIGGCLVPMALTVELLYHGRANSRKAGLGILVVAVATYIFASPVAGQGITLPFWISPLLAAIIGLALARRRDSSPVLAYISGTIGTLLGADIFNLITPGVLPALSPPNITATKPLVLSIGGAGVFDGIFLTGILAVFFAAGIVCLFHGSCEGLTMHRDRNRVGQR